MRNFFLFIFLLNLLTSCQSVTDGFKLKKKDGADEFLVEKKNPLVLPPNYNDLPTPESVNPSNEKDIDSFKSTITKSENNESEQNSSKSSSTEESILKNIKKDETN